MTPPSPGEGPARVLVAGISTRAIAESAVLAGFSVTSIDAFGDLDQHPAVCRHALHDAYSADEASRFAEAIDCDAVAYTSNFENHPAAVRTLAAGRALWGNTPDVLSQVRNPMTLADAFLRGGCQSPAIIAPGHQPAIDDHRQWLEKPIASGGGYRVRRWLRSAPTSPRVYLQERVDGVPCSVVFVAGSGHAVPLAVSRQLIGERAFGAVGYQHCGNILAGGADERRGTDDLLIDGAARLADVAASSFGLVGINNIDFILRNGVLHPIELNPRWSSSVELGERAYGLSAFATHAAACTNGTLPDFNLRRAWKDAGAVGPIGTVGTVGKAVVFARTDTTVGDTRAWLDDPMVRDVPRRGERILAGRPICTVFAVSPSGDDCYLELVRRAERVYASVDAWPRSAT